MILKKSETVHRLGIVTFSQLTSRLKFKLFHEAFQLFGQHF